MACLHLKVLRNIAWYIFCDIVKIYYCHYIILLLNPPYLPLNLPFSINAQVIARPFITEDALSLNDIWNRLRIRYRFRKSGGLMFELDWKKMSLTRVYGSVCMPLSQTMFLSKPMVYNIYSMLRHTQRRWLLHYWMRLFLSGWMRSIQDWML